MTKEQRERLEPFEKNLHNAVKNDYVYMKASDFAVVAEVYAEIFQPLRKGQMGCNSCRIAALKKLGEEYFKDEKTENKKKAGRPKKIKDEEN